MLLLQLGLKLVIITNDAVVDDSDATGMIKVRVCIHVRLVAMSSPAGVPDGDVVVVFRGAMDADTLDTIATKAI